MGLPVSKKELDRLGDRLRDSAVTSVEDLQLLEAVRPHYLAALGEVCAALGRRGLDPTYREKNRETIVDKLRREGDMRLSRVQDIVGARVVRDVSLAEQDALVALIVADFADHRIRDRRREPSFGYRAVHIVARLDGIPVEIQVRTEQQHTWAQTMERLGDYWGRPIRYGGEPQDPDRMHDVLAGGQPKSRRNWVALVKSLSAIIAADEQTGTTTLIEVEGAPGLWSARQLLDSLRKADL
jgi:hypothetical protein